MNLGIDGKVALVFGAAGGLGGAIARALANEGVKLVLADYNAEGLAKEASNSEYVAAQPLTLSWDLANLDLMENNYSIIEEKLGGVDILVNNTGGPPPSTAANIPSDQWKKFFDSMVLSVVKITDRALPKMRERKWGRIITSTSSGVVSPIPNLGLSNALRSTLVGWSKTLAREVAEDGITANIVLPGRIATARIAQLDEARAKRENISLDDVVAESVRSIPAARYGKPEEYADVVAFLASKRAAYLTGSLIRVDGGYISSI
jgi:3-oxoacyl-[acyl-carrier protein] reductase